jgi:hypothetical protein
MTDEDWRKLLGLVTELQKFSDEELVLIGGIAVYSHVRSKEDTSQYAAQSLDADFMILLSYYAELRDIEMLMPNKGLTKQQFIKNGFEFNVYVEGQTDLCVPVPETVSASQMKNGLRVACIEHLLILKANALANRKNTSKGDKDEDDICRILLAADAIEPDKLTRLDDDLLSEISHAIKGDAALRLANGNNHIARGLRTKINNRFSEAEEAHRLNYEGCKP